MAKTGFALGWMVAITCVQSSGSQTQPIEVARTHAIGGQCERIVLANDQQHALSIGDYGDLIWWDLKSGQPIQHVPGHNDYVAGVALHPTQPLAVVSWTDGRYSGEVHAVDLNTGKTTLWLEHPAGLLIFNATGDRIATSEIESGRNRKSTYIVANLKNQKREPLWRDAWRPHGSPIDNDLEFLTADTVIGKRTAKPSYSARHVFSADGKTRASHKGQVITIGKTKISVNAFCNGWIRPIAVTNNATVLAADAFGQMVVLRANGEPGNTPAPHRGFADRLVFSPDGSHLAIMTLGALRIVDLAGNERLSLAGTHIASPGEDGAEFWIASPAGAWRWNAASLTEVGKRMTWRVPDIALITSSWQPIRFGRRPFRLWRLNIADIDPKLMWYFTRDTGKVARQLVRQTPGELHTSKQGPINDPVTLTQLNGTDDVLLHTCGHNLLNDGTSMFVHRLDATGQVQHHWHAYGSPAWQVLNDTQTTMWVCSGGAIFGLACKDLDEQAHHTSENRWHSGIAWHNDHLLLTDGKTLQEIDPMTMEKARSFDLPKDLTQLDLLAASPDRSHLAIATRSEVRILRLQ